MSKSTTKFCLNFLSLALTLGFALQVSASEATPFPPEIAQNVLNNLNGKFHCLSRTREGSDFLSLDHYKYKGAMVSINLKRSKELARVPHFTFDLYTPACILKMVLLSKGFMTYMLKGAEGTSKVEKGNWVLNPTNANGAVFTLNLKDETKVEVTVLPSEVNSVVVSMRTSDDSQFREYICRPDLSAGLKDLSLDDKA